MWAFIFLACQSCFELPNDVDPEDRQDTSTPDSAGDTADSAPVDSGPPPMCEVEVFETGDHSEDYKTDIPVPTEAWVCGYFDSVIDFERLVFDVPEGAWLSLDFEGETRGSSADGIVSAYPLADDTDQCTQYNSPIGADPHLTFPVNTGGSWMAMLTEYEQGWGDAFPWWFRASLVKAPVSYDTTVAAMVAANGGAGLDGASEATALPFTDGSVVFGQLAYGEVITWYRLVLPAGMNQVTLTTHAAEFGSHADTAMYIYEEDSAGGLHLDNYDVSAAYDTSNSDSGWDSLGFNAVGHSLGNHVDEAGNPLTTVAVVFGVLHTGTRCSDQYLWYTVEASTYYADPASGE